MGYRVDYQPIKKVRGAEKYKSRVTALTALGLVLFFLLVNSCWPRGAEVLKGLLFPGEAAVTVSALEELAVELKSGQTLSDSLETFCAKVIRETKFD